MSIEMTPRLQVGGTLRPDALYVARKADIDLPHQLSRREYCHVLAPRQIGKSSLSIRAAQALQSNGVRCGRIDLSSLGSNLDSGPEDWYFSLIDQLHGSLNLTDDPADFWAGLGHGTPVARWRHYLRDVVLAQIRDPIVVFIDELDVLRDSTVGADDFFNSVRGLYDARATESIYERLTFCLIGVSLPEDLVKNQGTSPFNVGYKVPLRDFTRSESDQFALALRVVTPHTDAVLDAIYGWTCGHPYMTHRLCWELSQRGIPADTSIEPIEHVVKAIVDRAFLAGGRTDEFTLAEAGRYFARDDQRLYAGELLQLYRRLLLEERLNERVAFDGNNEMQVRLRLIGMAAEREDKDGTWWLHVRNRIVAEVFNKDWIDARETDRYLAKPLATWMESGRSEDKVLRGKELIAAIDWSQFPSVHPTPDEEAFIRASQTVEQRVTRQFYLMWIKRGGTVSTIAAILAFVWIQVLVRNATAAKNTARIAQNQTKVAKYQNSQLQIANSILNKDNFQLQGTKLQLQGEQKRLKNDNTNLMTSNSKLQNGQTKLKGENANITNIAADQLSQVLINQGYNAIDIDPALSVVLARDAADFTDSTSPAALLQSAIKNTPVFCRISPNGFRRRRYFLTPKLGPNDPFAVDPDLSMVLIGNKSGENRKPHLSTIELRDVPTGQILDILHLAESERFIAPEAATTSLVWTMQGDKGDGHLKVYRLAPHHLNRPALSINQVRCFAYTNGDWPCCVVTTSGKLLMYKGPNAQPTTISGTWPDCISVWVHSSGKVIVLIRPHDLVWIGLDTSNPSVRTLPWSNNGPGNKLSDSTRVKWGPKVEDLLVYSEDYEKWSITAINANSKANCLVASGEFDILSGSIFETARDGQRLLVKTEELFSSQPRVIDLDWQQGGTVPVLMPDRKNRGILPGEKPAQSDVELLVAALSPNGNFVILGNAVTGRSGTQLPRYTVESWDLTPLDDTSTLAPDAAPLRSDINIPVRIAYSRDSSRVAVWDADGMTHVFQVRAAAPLLFSQSLRMPEEWERRFWPTVTNANNGRFATVSFSNNDTRIYDMKEPSETRLNPINQPILQTCISSDASLLTVVTKREILVFSHGVLKRQLWLPSQAEIGRIRNGICHGSVHTIPGVTGW